jgi:hypothetical protein
MTGALTERGDEGREGARGRRREEGMCQNRQRSGVPCLALCSLGQRHTGV